MVDMIMHNAENNKP